MALIKKRVKVSRRSLMKRLGLLMTDSLLTVVLSIITLAVILRIAGSTVYSSVIVAQALGASGAIVIQYGWSVVGPPLIARADYGLRQQIYAQSLAVRLWLFVPVAFTAYSIAVYVGTGTYLTWLPLLTGLLQSFSASWFFIGAGRGKLLVILDTLPRVILTVAGLTMALLLDSIGILLIIQLASVILTCTASSVAILGRRRLTVSDLGLPMVKLVIRSHAPSAVTLGVTGFYVTLPAVLLSFVDSQSVTSFAAMDRVGQLTLALTKPIAQFFQSWVPGASQMGVARRVRIAVLTSALLSIILAASITLSADPLVSTVTGGRVHVPAAAALFLGITVGTISVSRVVGLTCLTTLNAVGKIMYSTILGAVVGLSLVPPLGAAFGFTGAWLALAAAEASVLTFQLIALRKHLIISRSLSVAQPIPPASTKMSM